MSYHTPNAYSPPPPPACLPTPTPPNLLLPPPYLIRNLQFTRNFNIPIRLFG